MKHIVRYLFFSMTSLFVGHVACQNTIFKTHDIYTYSNIIREYSDDVCINYGKMSEQQGCFEYVDYTIPHAIVRKLPIDIEVTDFEIADGKVFFCGTKSWNSAVFGYFDISAIFFSTAPIRCFTLPQNIGGNRFVWFNKIEVMIVERDTHLLVTGQDDIQENMWGVADIVLGSQNPSNATMYYFFDDSYMYDDVAVTDAEVVFTSRSSSGNNYGAHVLHSLPLPTMSGETVFDGLTQLYPSSYEVPIFVIPNSYMIVETPITIENIYGGCFATVGSARMLNNISAPFINLFSSSSNLYFSCWIKSDNTHGYRELKYNMSDNLLYLVPGYYDYFHSIYFPPCSKPEGDVVESRPGSLVPIVNTVDHATYSGGAVLTGYSLFSLNTFFLQYPTQCVTDTNITIVSREVDNNRNRNVIEVEYLILNGVDIVPDSTVNRIDIICSRK